MKRIVSVQARDCLVSYLSRFSQEDIFKLEELDRQFIALKNLYENIPDKKYFLFLIVVNSLVCYQLSSKGEDYWEEFSEYFINNKITIESFAFVFSDFLNWSKGNRRLLKIKIKRLEKITSLFGGFSWKEELFFSNLLLLRDLLCDKMWQKKDAKTIVFALKMFWYWSRIYFWKKVVFPFEISIPLDSRLEKINDKFWNKNVSAFIFFDEIAKEIGVPSLHLDVVLWLNNREILSLP